jgi:thioredoxin-like negative regulator of GroEL
MADAASPHWPQDIDRLLAGTPDNASLRAALAQSQKEFNRQTRQLDRLVKLADANGAIERAALVKPTARRFEAI